MSSYNTSLFLKKNDLKRGINSNLAHTQGQPLLCANVYNSMLAKCKEKHAHAREQAQIHKSTLTLSLSQTLHPKPCLSLSLSLSLSLYNT